MRRATLVLILTAAVVGCGGQASRRAEATLPFHRPAAILVDRILDAPVKGQALRKPSAMVTDFRGNSYLLDEGNNRVIKFDTLMEPIIERGGYGNQPGLFNRPRALAIDNQLNLWICDAGNRRLVRLDGQLNFVDEIPFTDDEDPLKFGEPSGIAVTNYGALWVADLERDRVAVFDNVGQFEKFIGDFGAGGGPVRDPEGCATDGDDRFCVCDGGNQRVMVYDAYGSDVDELTDDEMVLPVAAIVDRQGRVWVLDKLANRVFCFDHEGRNLVPSGVPIIGRGSEELLPGGFSLLTDSTMAIADAANGRLLVCKLILE